MHRAPGNRQRRHFLEAKTRRFASKSALSRLAKPRKIQKKREVLLREEGLKPLETELDFLIHKEKSKVGPGEYNLPAPAPLHPGTNFDKGGDAQAKRGKQLASMGVGVGRRSGVTADPTVITYMAKITPQACTRSLLEPAASPLRGDILLSAND